MGNYMVENNFSAREYWKNGELFSQKLMLFIRYLNVVGVVLLISFVKLVRT
jgi:hypothetical protein